MDKLTYVRMEDENDTDIEKLTEIYQTPDTARYISISDNYFHYVTNTENVYFYKVYENGTLIGATHLEKQDDVLFMDILVFTEFQGMGYGTRIIKDIQDDIFGLCYKTIEVYIDASNYASKKLFMKSNFDFVSEEDELMKFVYRKD